MSGTAQAMGSNPIPRKALRVRKNYYKEIFKMKKITVEEMMQALEACKKDPSNMEAEKIVMDYCIQIGALKTFTMIIPTQE